jgi:ATP-dependent Clp protease ATP-binding subunit ClpA
MWQEADAVVAMADSIDQNHHVIYDDGVIESIVMYSERYISERCLPDKAIDILDGACSRINLENKELFRLEMLKQELSTVQAQKEDAANADSTEDYQKAADLKTQECRLLEEIDHLNSTIEL